jgi:Flp pilus assembly protein TadD
MHSLTEMEQGDQVAGRTVCSGTVEGASGDDPSSRTPASPAVTAERFGVRVIFAAEPHPKSGRRRRFALLFAILSLAAGGGWLHARLASADTPPTEPKQAPLPVAPAPAGTELAPAPAPKRHRPHPPGEAEATEVARRLELVPMPEESNFVVTRHAAPAPDPRLSAAWMALLHGDPAAAIGGYEEVLAATPENRQALLGIAAVEARRGEAARARRAYLRLLQRDPADPLALAGLLELEPAGDPTARVRRLKQLIARHPDIASLHSAIGNVYAGEERWLDAERAYAQARMIEQRAGLLDPQTNFNLAVALDHQGKKSEARARYEEALIGARQGSPAFDAEAAEARLRALSEI